MNKKIKPYALAWAVMLLLFNVIAFVSVGWKGQEKYTASFWIGYVTVMLAFFGQLYCAFRAFKAQDAKAFFLRVPLIRISYTGLLLTFVFGGPCMLISPLPYYAGTIVCAVVLAFTAIAVIKADAAADVVEHTDAKVKAQTLFVKALTADAESLLSRAATPEAKDACRKVFEAVRYSDPMSNDALAGVESQITLKFNEFSRAVTDNADNAGTLADELIALVGDRNRKCKLVK